MIKTFRHKGLKLLYEEDDGRKLPPSMVERIRIILSTLEAAQEIEGMNVPTFRLHQLKGEKKGLLRGYGSRELADCFFFQRRKRL